MGQVYTQLKIFHFPEKVNSLPAQVDAILPPVHIRIKPTNVCNHRCSYCAYRAPDLQLGRDMNERDTIPHEKMLEIIDDLIEMDVKAVTFSGGGEPFCYPHLLEMARKLADSPIRFAALTNGSRITGEVAEVFAHHAAWLRVSIDGWDDASYARYRRVPEGEFARVLKNLRNFKQLQGSCFTGASVIVDRDNAGHILELIDKLCDTGIDSVKVSPCVVSNSGSENNVYHEPVFEQVKDQLDRARQQYARNGFEIYDAYHHQLDSFAKAYTWCPYQQILPIIGADRNVYSCQDKAYNLEKGLLGSIRDVRFRDFWFSDKKRFFRIDPSQWCDHHCVADGKNRMILDYLAADRDHLAFV
ncbi:MAG: radical SAM protein [Sedimentisphaerales bacterium]|nr:radical SAM protein [Sedimentisphaerales bacterium]